MARRLAAGNTCVCVCVCVCVCPEGCQCFMRGTPAAGATGVCSRGKHGKHAATKMRLMAAASAIAALPCEAHIPLSSGVHRWCEEAAAGGPGGWGQQGCGRARRRSALERTPALGSSPWGALGARDRTEGARRVRGARTGVRTASLRSVLALCTLALCELAPTVLVLRVPAACALAVCARARVACACCVCPCCACLCCAPSCWACACAAVV